MSKKKKTNRLSKSFPGRKSAVQKYGRSIGGTISIKKRLRKARKKVD